MTPDELFESLKAQFAGLEKAAAPVKGYLTLKATKQELLPLVTHLKAAGFDYLEIVTATDWKGPVDPRGYIVDPNPNHFLPEGATPQAAPGAPTPGVAYRDAIELVYLLGDLGARKMKLFIKLDVPRDQASAPSLVPLFKAADWQEREVFDLLGVTFEGHPNLKKILTPDFLTGHPLRKDYVHVPDAYD